jgi:hypothetical protein
MKKIILLIILQLLVKISVHAVTFELDTLQFKGDIDKYINIVILGDGYTSSEQDQFITDATNLSEYILSKAPWSNYSGYFNVFAIKVISLQSGAKHPNTASDCNSASPLVPVSNPDTYLGCSFDSYNIHRLVVPVNISNISAILSSTFPNYDQVLIIANSPYYGGSGGTYATSTTDADSKEVISHETGHSFASLADEYWAGDSYATEKVNMTTQSNPSLVKWKNWIGTTNIGVFPYCCGGSSASWYKPGNHTCEMEVLNSPFCSVCSQAIIETIHALVNPIAGYSPDNTSVSSPNNLLDFKITDLIRPVPNTLKICWELDSVIIAENIDSVEIIRNNLARGVHKLVLGVTDTTSLLKVDNHSTVHLNTVTWSIYKEVSGISLQSSENRIAYSLYPNPATDVVNVSFNLEKRTSVSVSLVSVDGKIIQYIVNKTLDKGKHEYTANIAELLIGTYYVVFKFGNFIRTEPVVKE